MNDTDEFVKPLLGTKYGALISAIQWLLLLLLLLLLLIIPICQTSKNNYVRTAVVPKPQL
jgi:hypothetical protein